MQQRGGGSQTEGDGCQTKGVVAEKATEGLVD